MINVSDGNSTSDGEDPDWRPSTKQKTCANVSTCRSTRSTEKESDARSKPTNSGGSTTTRRMSTSKEPDHVQWIEPGGDGHGHGPPIVYGDSTQLIGTKRIGEDWMFGEATHSRVHKRRELPQPREHTLDMGSSGLQVAKDTVVKEPVTVNIMLARQDSDSDVVEVAAPASEKNISLSACAAESVLRADMMQNRIDACIKENEEERKREAEKLAQALEDLESERKARIAAELTAWTTARRLNKEIQNRAAAEDREKVALDRCIALEERMAFEFQAKTAGVDVGRKLNEEVERRAAAEVSEKEASERRAALEGRIAALEAENMDHLSERVTIMFYREEVENRLLAENRERVALDRCVALESQRTDFLSREAVTTKILTEEIEKRLSAEGREHVALDRCVALEERIAELEAQKTGLLSKQVVVVKQETM